MRVHFLSLCGLLTLHRILFLPPIRPKQTIWAFPLALIRRCYALSWFCLVCDEFGAMHMLMYLWPMNHFWKMSAPLWRYYLWSLKNLYDRVTGPYVMWACNLGQIPRPTTAVICFSTSPSPFAGRQSQLVIRMWVDMIDVTPGPEHLKVAWHPFFSYAIAKTLEISIWLQNDRASISLGLWNRTVLESPKNIRRFWWVRNKL